ncbi:MAG: hypothetical protein AAB414_03860 [Patescibacteria group bacterium]
MAQIFTKKNILNLLILGIMVLAIPLSINLIRQQQILKSRAASTDIKFLTKDDPGGTDCVKSRGGKFVATCADIKVRITAPTGAEARPKTAGIISKVYAVEPGYCEDGYTFNGGDAGDNNNWTYTGCGTSVNPGSPGGGGAAPPPAEPPAAPPPAGGTCPGDGECGAYWGTGASCNSSSGDAREDGCYGGCEREAQDCEGGSQMWCINAHCPDAACYDVEEGGSVVTECPSSSTPSACIELLLDEYPQCGGTCNDTTYASDHTVFVYKLVDSLCYVTYKCDDQGKKPGECGNPGQAGGTPPGKGGCCSKDDDCNTAGNTYKGQSTAGWKCSDSNPYCQGSGNNACKAPSAGIGVTKPQTPAGGSFAITKYRYAVTPTDVRSAAWNSFPATGGSVVINYPSASLTLGQKLFLFVQFTDESESTIIPDPPAQNKDAVEFMGEDPVMTGSACDINLDLQDNSLLFKVNGKNFGEKESGSSLKANDTSLEIKSWKDDKVIARMANPTDTSSGRTFQVKLTRPDGATVTQDCEVNTTKITLGAKWICQAPTALDLPDVDLSVFEMVGIGTSATVGVGTSTPQSFTVGSKTREKVKVEKGVLKNIKAVLKEDEDYIICIDAPRSVRSCSGVFRGSSGNNIIQNFNVAFGNLNDDECIGLFDVSVLKQQFGKLTPTKNCDFNNDGLCNVFEFSCVRKNYNKCDQEEPQ